MTTKENKETFEIRTKGIKVEDTKKSRPFPKRPYHPVAVQEEFLKSQLRGLQKNTIICEEKLNLVGQRSLELDELCEYFYDIVYNLIASGRVSEGGLADLSEEMKAFENHRLFDVSDILRRESKMSNGKLKQLQYIIHKVKINKMTQKHRKQL